MKMTEWDKAKKRLLNSVENSDDTPTEEQNRIYDLLVGALIAEGNKLQEKAKKWEEFEEFITVDILTKNGPIAFGNPIPLRELIGIRKKLEAIKGVLKEFRNMPKYARLNMRCRMILEDSEFNKKGE